MRVALPIDARLDEIVQSLEGGQNLVIVAEPGAGKTTRVPPALARASFARKGRVVVLEPRRLAARLSATRVAEELGERLGQTVGYAVRFERKQSAATRVMFVTEALLVRQLLDDARLSDVNTVVLDEFHERSIHTDLALALLRRLQRSARPDLRLVVMSATLDAQAVASFLDAPVIDVAGRTHPVEIHHLEQPDDRHLDKQVEVALRRVVLRGVEGDVLVFLPGAGEIRRAQQACEGFAKQQELELCMLHGDMPAKEQDRVLREGPRRKVIFSTNIAETSLTLPRVGAVIDSGLARVAGHSPWSGLATLSTQRISQASATQRAGRAGRVRAGVCHRLYTASDFAERPAFELPEVRRIDLSETALVWAGASGLPPLPQPGAARPEGADGADQQLWFEPPPAAAWSAAQELLRMLGASSDTGLTAIGAALLKLPLHPRLGRLALAATEAGFPEEAATLAALLGERDLRLDRRMGGGRAGFGSGGGSDEVGDSDLLARLDAYEALGGDDSAVQARRHDLDARVVRAVSRTRERLLRALPRAPRPERDRDEALLRAVLVAYPDRVAKRRKPAAPEVVFAAGGSGKLADTSVVKEAELLVALDAAQQRGGVVVRVASAVESDWLFEDLFDSLQEERTHAFDANRKKVDAFSRLKLGQVVLEETRRPATPCPEATDALVTALIAAGSSAPWDTEAVEALVRRVGFAAQYDDAFEPLDEAALRLAIGQHAEGMTSFEEVASMPFVQSLRASLGASAQQLDRLAPGHVQLPSGRRLTVNYEVDRPPWVKSRLQDFFGMLDGPRLANGKVPLVLHLLAPNQRPVQVSTDLAGFWDRHYPTLRKELMRRYPRHEWPEEPRTATPPAPRPPRAPRKKKKKG